MNMSKTGDSPLSTASQALTGSAAPAVLVSGVAHDATPGPAETELDAAALNNLRELDPQGTAGLLVRVVQAFDISAQRLVPQLEVAVQAGDMSGVRHVAHTLKSSSASVGALTLSRCCAELEAQARESRSEGLAERAAVLIHEVAAARRALHRLVDPTA
jgi:HPt (histidine-containing phosphotransfer) domain-containing protein